MRKPEIKLTLRVIYLLKQIQKRDKPSNQDKDDFFKELVLDLNNDEDIEDELGCPLEVVTSKTAMVVKDNEIYEVDIMAVSFTNGNIYFGNEWSFTTKKIKDYKKTWWLKEDLSE